MLSHLFVEAGRNEDVLVSDLQLKRDKKNTSLFYKEDTMVISPYVSESKERFDISEENIKRFMEGSFKKGYLLIRHGETFLILDLQVFINELTDKDSKTPYDRYVTNPKYRWQYKVIKDGCWQIQRISRKKLLPIREVNIEEMRKIIN